MSVLQQETNGEAGKYEMGELQRRFRKPLQKYMSKNPRVGRSNPAKSCPAESRRFQPQDGKSMTVDERLERLRERHEALAQSVELMGQITGQRINEVTTAINKNAENIRVLAHIAESRMDRHN